MSGAVGGREVLEQVQLHGTLEVWFVRVLPAADASVLAFGSGGDGACMDGVKGIDNSAMRQDVDTVAELIAKIEEAVDEGEEL